MAYCGEIRKKKANETRQRIYESAERLFAAQGPDAISVESVVKAAGVSKGSFYVHFASKNALLAELVDDYVLKADAEYQHYLNSLPDDTPAEDVLLLLIGKIGDVLVNDIGVDKIKVVYKAQIEGDTGIGAVANYNRLIYGMFHNVLERGISRGEFRADMPPGLLARHLLLAVRGVTYEWCIRHPDFDYKAQALAHFALLLKGLRAPRSG
jgi:AcrR family transcriptional regulator